MKNKIVLFILCLSFLFSCGGKKMDADSTSEETTAKTLDSKPKRLEIIKKEKEPVPAEQLAKAKEIIAAVSEDDIKVVDAKKIFKATCSSCHGTTGNLKLNGATDLTKSTNSLEESGCSDSFWERLDVALQKCFIRGGDCGFSWLY